MRKFRRWWIGVLAVAVALASVTVPGGEYASAAPGDNRAGLAGEGSAIRPYQISTAEQLYAFSLYQDDYLNAHLELVADIDFTGWDWDALPWNPIGSSGGAFTGTFDGNGHAIHGLVVHLSEQSKVGMFGQVGIGGVLQRLSLIDANVEGKAYVGALAGDIREGTVENVSVTGTVQGSERIGGLIGFTTRGFVLNSHAGADVTGTRYVGGLIGYSVSEIQASSARGNVRGTTQVGGLVGINSDSVIRFSYATGDVFGSGDDAGGLVGENYLTSLVEYSYATGNVSGNSYVGGLIGRSSYSSIVLNSYASGNVESQLKIGGLPV